LDEIQSLIFGKALKFLLKMYRSKKVSNF